MYLEKKKELLSLLRDRNLQIDLFRKTAQELIRLIAMEQKNARDVVLVPILRSGLAMLDPFMEVFPDAPIGFLGMFRDETTLKPHLYYKKLPVIHSRQTILILDPMLATGGSVQLAIQQILQQNIAESQIRVISLIGSTMGVQAVRTKHPHVRIECVAIDDKLSSLGIIVPGLGDFGDRFFGTGNR